MENDNGIKLDVRAPGGFLATLSGLTGKQLLLFLIFVVLAAILAIMVRNETQRDNQFAAIMVQFHDTVGRDTKANTDRQVLLEAIKLVAEEQRATTYVLTLDEKERKNLRLQMPKSLQERERR